MPTCKNGHTYIPKTKSGNKRGCPTCQNERRKRYDAEDPERQRARGRKSAAKRRKRWRDNALAHYGPDCRCCGESERSFLELDHIDGGGNAHRLEINKGKHNKGSTPTMHWLEMNGYPPGFQVLCANCNKSKAILGECAHTLSRR